jgi:hypothetical protein
MKKTLCVVLSFTFLTITYGQTYDQSYIDLVKKAESLYAEKQYKASAMEYSNAIHRNKGRGKLSDLYNAACSWAMANYPDSAFAYLRLCVAMNYVNYEHISKDSDLNSIHTDSRWELLLNQVKENAKENMAKIEAKYNKPLRQELLEISKNDQEFRKKRNIVIKEQGIDAKAVDSLTKLMLAMDSVNLVRIVAFLNKYGWQSPDQVGRDASTTQFLVIQHADLQTQIKYLPMIRKAVSDGYEFPDNLALLEDRMALRQGKKQLYGTQLILDPETNKYIILPVEDPDNLNKRRKETGMAHLDAYLKMADSKLKWDPEQHKKDLPEIKKIFKKVKEKYGGY